MAVGSGRVRVSTWEAKAAPWPATAGLAMVAAGSQRLCDGSLHKIVGSGMSYGCPYGGFIGSAKPTPAARIDDRAGRSWPTGGLRTKEGGAVWLG